MIPRPQSIQVGGRIYRVVIDPNLQLNEGFQGSCDHQKLTIHLLPRYYPSQLNEGLLHEILHAISNVYLNGKLSEDEINSIGEGLMQVLQGMGINFKWEPEAMRKD